jgi:eukaryotic-like serine/threonine-protein kinase
MREELIQGFLQEGKLMTSLSTRSAAIVQARDVGTLTTPAGQSVPYMVLEWLDGRPLDAVLATEYASGAPARTLPQAMTLLEPAVGALDIAHAQGMAHRDIKPANFFVVGDPGGEHMVKILDFGIAKVMSEHAQLQTALAKTGTNITAFTPNYGAPEQFSRTYGATGPWTDVYALALVIVEILRGGVPALEGDDYLQLAVASRDPMVRPTPRAFGLDLSDQVESVFLKALAIAPGDRHHAPRASSGRSSTPRPFPGHRSGARPPRATRWGGAPSRTRRPRPRVTRVCPPVSWGCNRRRAPRAPRYSPPPAAPASFERASCPRARRGARPRCSTRAARCSRSRRRRGLALQALRHGGAPSRRRGTGSGCAHRE